MLFNRERALAIMDKHGIDVLVATSPENVYYLSDYGTEHSFHFGPGGFSAAIFPRDLEKPPTLIVQEWELPYLTGAPSWMPELRTLLGFDVYVPESAELGPTETALVQMVEEGRKTGSDNRQRQVGAVLREYGLDRSRIACDELEAAVELREIDLPEATFVGGVNVFREIRNVKTGEEIALLRHAAKVLETSLRGVANLIEPGATPRELMTYFRTSMAEQGGFGSHMTGGGGQHPWLSHYNMSYQFKEGDVVYLDPAGHYKHYWADMGRAAIVGEMTPKLEERYGRLQECHRTVVPMLRAGASSRQIMAEARRSVEGHMKAGFVPLIHSMGIEHYDHPQSIGTFLSEDWTLEPGMVLNFETLYFELGWGLLQLEDTYLIGSSEPERLQTLEQAPMVCPIHL